MDLHPPGFLAFAGQDQFLFEYFFRGKRDGVFVDVGGKVWQGRAEIEKEAAGGENPSARAWIVNRSVR